MSQTRWERFVSVVKALIWPGRSAGFTVSSDMSSGELRLDLDVDGVLGSVYLSKQMWMTIGAQAGWVTEQEARDCWTDGSVKVPKFDKGK